MKDTIKTLVEKLNYYRYQYYNHDRSIISDKEYDALFDELLDLEHKTGHILPESPTQSVGFKVVSKLKKSVHEFHMLSLQKTKSIHDITDFINSQEAVISLKLDGLTVVLKYVNGRLKQALTRGDGIEGEDITHNANVIPSIPKRISLKGTVYIRGEALISWKQFDKINEDLEEKYKHPRNLASGSIRQLNSEICAERGVEFFAFEIVDSNSVNYTTDLTLLEGMGFNVVHNKNVDKESVNDIIDFYTEYVKLCDYPVDGLVVTFNNNEYKKSLGSTSHHPKHSIAFKWQDEEYKTTLTDIEWQTSRTGLINPVAVFEPVDIDGTTIQRASLHNISQIKKLKLGYNDDITIYKANMIIPQVAENLTRSNSFKIPSTCPVCKQKTYIHVNGDIETLYCSNPNCEAVVVGKFDHFCASMDMKGISEKILQKIYQRGIITKLSDLFKLTHIDLIRIEGFKDKSVENILNTISSNKNKPLSTILSSLGIKHCGKNVSKLIGERYKTFGELFDMKEEDILSIDGIGEEIANELIKGLRERRYEIVELLSYLTLEEQKEKTNTKLSGKSFCISGSTEKGKAYLYNLVEENGGISEKNVVKGLDYLITNETSTGKIKKATDYGIKIISELDFLEMIGIIEEKKEEKKTDTIF